MNLNTHSDSKLSQMGERNLIAHIKQAFSKNVPMHVLGIGDDCAVIPENHGFSTLVTTDLLIEHVHFSLSTISPMDLGYKSLAVSLSDIAAMGGSSMYAWLSVAIPKHTQIQWIFDFVQGFKRLCEESNTSLLGGDTTGSHRDIMVSVTVLGRAKSKNIKYRSGASKGDRICVTTTLGDSRAGLECLQNNIQETFVKSLIQWHCHPTPSLAQGQWLGLQSGVGAMMDISDGLWADIKQIMQASQCGVHISLESIPLSQDFVRFSEMLHKNAFEYAAIGGEDYGLLITVRPESFESVARDFKQNFGTDLYVVGVVTDQCNILTSTLNHSPVEINDKGFRHF